MIPSIRIANNLHPFVTGPLPDKALWDAGANALYPSMMALSERIGEHFNR
jgi:hypothetical protein